ncbi:MAG TPA: glycosyl transferase, partial [Rhodospirillaceae bacterium]|nr:glycosyl transferase [Rhodospirillaceae bacterium]
EPLGNVVLEGWAQQKPVIAAESAGPKALITPGHTGCLVSVDDATALAEAIQSLLASADQANSLAEAGFNAYQEGFTEARVIALYENFFEAVTG